MRNNLLLTILLVTSGCAHEWVHPEYLDDTTRIAKDRYECMQESQYVGTTTSIDRRSARSNTGVEIDQVLLHACMEARGYTWERASPSAREKTWAGAPPPDAPVIAGVDLGVGGNYGIRHDWVVDYTDYAAGDASGGSYAHRSAQQTYGGLTFGGRVEVPVGRHGAFAARLGLRGSNVDTTVDCMLEGGDADYCSQEASHYASPAALYAGVDGRARLPPAPRLSATLGFGLQPVSASDSYTGTTRVSPDQGDDLEAPLEIPRGRGSLMPHLRIGVDFDIAWADPIGLTVGCSVEQLLRSSLIDGTATLEGPDQTFTDRGDPGTLWGCALGLKWAPVVR